jgi:rfaE bifunctional protein kinase chain/domain
MNRERLEELANRYRQLRIGVVGDFFLDRYLHIDAAKAEKSIETGLPVHNVVAVRSQPGAAGTILNNLVALEVGAIHAVGYCGDDGEGYELRRALARLRGVSLENLVTSSSRLTPVYCKPLLFEPGRLPRELNRLDTKNWSPTPGDLERDLADRVGKLAPSIDVLLLLDQVDIAETGVATRFVCEAVYAAMREHKGLRVLADSRQGLHHFPPVGFKMNAAELGRMTQSSSNELEAVKARAAVLANSTGQPVFVTLAERGIVGAFPGQNPDYVPAYPVRGPIDVVGAGDAVTANLATALAAGASPREAMELAMAAASLVIHQLDTTGTASIRQIGSLLAQHTS